MTRPSGVSTHSALAPTAGSHGVCWASRARPRLRTQRTGSQDRTVRLAAVVRSRCHSAAPPALLRDLVLGPWARLEALERGGRALQGCPVGQDFSVEQEPAGLGALPAACPDAPTPGPWRRGVLRGGRRPAGRRSGDRSQAAVWGRQLFRGKGSALGGRADVGRSLRATRAVLSE